MLETNDLFSLLINTVKYNNAPVKKPTQDTRVRIAKVVTGETFSATCNDKYWRSHWQISNWFIQVNGPATTDVKTRLRATRRESIGKQAGRKRVAISLNSNNYRGSAPAGFAASACSSRIRSLLFYNFTFVATATLNIASIVEHRAISIPQAGGSLTQLPT